MQRAAVESIIRGLNEASCRYLIVGGLAVVAHGYVRLTADLDLVLDFEAGNLVRGLRVLEAHEYRPRAPVALLDFADAAKRQSWLRENNLKVFSLYSPKSPATEVDLFVEPPLDFASAYSRAQRLELAAGVQAAFVSLDDLLELKRRAGRPRDLDDIAQLKRIHDERTQG